MTNRLARPLALAVCAGLLVGPVALAGPAAADSEVRADPRGDTTTAVGRQLIPPPTQADILRLTSRHADGVVSMQVLLADLDTTSDVTATFGVLRPDGVRFAATVSRSSGDVSTRLVNVRSGGSVSCPSLRGGVAPSARRVSVSIPRLCLGRPRSVRTGVATSSSLGGTLEFTLDDARRDGEVRGDMQPFLGTRRLFLN